MRIDECVGKAVVRFFFTLYLEKYFSFIESQPKCTGKDLLIVIENLRPHIDRKNENITNELIVFIKLIN